MREIADYTNEKVARARRGEDGEHNLRMSWSRNVPPFLLNFLLFASTYVLNNLGWSMGFLKLKGRDMGQCAFHNVGLFGMKKGFAAMIHSTGTNIIIGMGKAEKRACVVDGEIVVRERLYFNYTSDHRHGDGGRAIKCITTIHKYLLDPEAYERTLLKQN